MAKVMITDLEQGATVRAEFLFHDVKAGLKKNGEKYYRCQLRDRSGSIAGVNWSLRQGVPVSGSILEVTGEVGTYNGAPQIEIKAVSPRQSTTDEDFTVTTAFSIDDMWAKVLACIGRMESEYFKTVATDLMLNQGYEEGFRTSPAATFLHHAFQGGLLEHTSQMCEIAEKLFELPFIVSNLNKDLCMFGIIFHDFCKMLEYSHSAGFKKTTQGILVPHIPMMGALVFETCNKFGVPEVVRDHMMHVILAHHGQQAYGSPVEMSIPEAAFVHHVDNLHGDIFGWIQKIEADKTQEHFKLFERTLVVERFSDILKSCTVETPTDTSLSF